MSRVFTLSANGKTMMYADVNTDVIAKLNGRSVIFLTREVVLLCQDLQMELERYE